MKKAFEFIESLKPSFIETCGYPTVKFTKETVEVYFDFANTIRDIKIFECSSCDEFMMFPSEFTKGFITCVYVFYLLPFE